MHMTAPMGRRVDERHRRRAAGGGLQAVDHGRDARSPTLATTVPPSGIATSQPERIARRHPRRRRRRGDPTPRSSVPRRLAGRRRSCRHIRRPRPRTPTPSRSAPWRARRRSAPAAGAPRRTPTDPARRDEHVDEPTRRGALAVRPRDADQRPARGGVGDDLLPGLDRDAELARRAQLGVVGIDRGQCLRDREPFSVGRRVTWAGVVARSPCRSPAASRALGVGRWSTLDRSRHDRPAAPRRAGLPRWRPPLPPRRRGSARRHAIGRAARTGSSPAPMAAASRVTRPVRSSRLDDQIDRAAAALYRLLPVRSPSHTTGGPRRRSRRRPRRRSARRAWPASRRRVRRPRSRRPRHPTPRRRRAPSAIARATCADTAPCASRTSPGTSTRPALISSV